MAAAGASGLYVNPNTGAAQAGLMPFRNALINGDMRINQRGTSTNLASMTAVGGTNAYVCDRWGVFRSGYATGAACAQGTNLTVGDLPFNEAGITTFARVGRVLSNTLTNAIFLAYALETQDSVKFKSKNVVFSGYYRTGANFSESQLNSRITIGTGTDEPLQRGGSVTGQVDYYVVFPISTTWSKFTYTIKLATNLNQVGLYIFYSPVGTAGANDYFDITGVQLELGSVATPFEVRPYPVELQLCQRYHQRFFGGIGLYCGDGNEYLVVFQYPVPMRATPVLTNSTISSQSGTFTVGWPKIQAYTSNAYAIILGMVGAQKGTAFYNVVADIEL
jgi:hypothetical protein